MLPKCRHICVIKFTVYNYIKFTYLLIYICRGHILNKIFYVVGTVSIVDVELVSSHHMPSLLSSGSSPTVASRRWLLTGSENIRSSIKGV